MIKRFIKITLFIPRIFIFSFEGLILTPFWIYQYVVNNKVVSTDQIENLITLNDL